MDISEKRTTLDDSASIYQKREEKTDRAKWKECKGVKAKWEHFKEYYLLKFFIAACVIAFVGYMVYEVVAPEKERMLYAAILDGVVLTTDMNELEEGYASYISMDEENQELYFDNTMNVSNRSDAVSKQKLTAHAFAGDIDVLIATEDVIKEYAGNYLLPLSEQLPADLYEALTDRFVYTRPLDEDGVYGEEAPYAIVITDLLPKNPYCKEELTMAICGNSKRAKNAEEFLRYLLENGRKQEEAVTE